MRDLTETQEKGLQCIKDHIEYYGFSPTRKDLAVMMEYKSANAAEELIRALARKGFIKIMPQVARGITLIEGSYDLKESGVGIKRTKRGVILRNKTGEIRLSDQQANAAVTGIRIAMQEG